MSERSGVQRFINELRRRHVPQTAAVYLVAAWAAIEFSDVVVPNLNGPQWVVTAVIVAAIVGFPVVLVLAWIFDWGPDGIHRTSERADAVGTRGPSEDGRSSAPWVAALAVLVVGIGSALAVAAVLAGGDGEAAGTTTEGEAPRMPAGGDDREPGGVPEPPAPPILVGPEYGESIRSRVLRGLDLEGLGGMAALAQLGELGGLDTMDVAELVEVGRQMAVEAGIHILITRPQEWRVGRTIPATLAPGDSLVVEGLVQDSAGVAEVEVDGSVVESLDEPRPTLRFRTTLLGTGGSGRRTVAIVVRTADGREHRREYTIIQVPEAPG